MAVCGKILTQFVPFPFHKYRKPSLLSTARTVELGINAFCLWILYNSNGAVSVLEITPDKPPIIRSINIYYNVEICLYNAYKDKLKIIRYNTLY